MEKRIIGIILTLLGVIGLITAGYYFMSSGSNTHSIKTIVMYGILGIIFFGAGIGLIRNTSDRPT
ncbi:MAG: hypothetical protein JWR61_3470 [Ferruginibacter sp.]|uniref:hypothetical protein n=1 Tax=Ferruginibacter sp. TaxID=1940288 RepID=UPI00265A6C27|nr:hypothetical protein [Ferruginibacter sp.]MDB5278515.1 hypothetical protein [Ferruginibacter sp.]